MNTSESTEPRPAARQVLAFALGGEHYAIDILAVREIRACGRVTRIANAPGFITGVTNLRGTIVPIVDLRIKFACAATADGSNAVVIVVNVGERLVGVVVDRVLDVMTLAADQIKPKPEFATGLPFAYLDGLADLGDRMLILVDVRKLLTSPELALVDEDAPG